ncbi:Imm8 family immunity protein [Nonomuraea wenchangensis]|uniref:Imm8 family immunity protein n=1 Tax=Nonomuraea wenchangensis TaxID=568860 RepID=UPI000B8369AC|nr:Imm8 family immunity protein [Nonomuraea wenchangensis]
MGGESTCGVPLGRSRGGAKDRRPGPRLRTPGNVCRPQGEPGGERFQLTVCTPSALKEQLGRHPFLIDKVTEWLSDRIAVLEAPTWGELAERIGRIGEWEFEDDIDGPML